MNWRRELGTTVTFILGLIAVASVLAGLYLLTIAIFSDIAYESSAGEAREVGALGIALILIPGAALVWAVLRPGRDEQQ
jgi:hypothetical protein